jgi:RNA polymerase sigma-70 factor (ECF subfamily)
MPSDPPQQGHDPGGEPAHASPGDDSLLRRIGAGSEAAADQLYQRYAARLHALARTQLPPDINSLVDADDIVQSVFRRFFDAARQGTYAAPTGEDLWNLLLVITLNRVRSLKTEHRAAKRDSRRTVQSGCDPAGYGGVAARDQTPAAVLRLVLEEALARLPAAYREVIELRVEGYEVAEIAQRTGRSKRTVERILQECRSSLRDLLNEDP